MQRKKKIAIVGSGLVGTLLAIYLKQLGNEVWVFDRRPDMREVSFSGRSINLAISDRGWKALREAGIEKEIRKLAIPMDKRAIHVVGKPLYLQPYGKKGEAIYSISRFSVRTIWKSVASAASTIIRSSGARAAFAPSGRHCNSSAARWFSPCWSRSSWPSPWKRRFGRVASCGLRSLLPGSSPRW